MLRNLIALMSARAPKPEPSLSPEQFMQRAFELLSGVRGGEELAQVRGLLMERFVAESRSRNKVVLSRAWRATEVYGRKLLQGQLI